MLSSNTSSARMPSKMTEPCCRICFETEETPRNALLRPCKCNGTSAWVHVDCLNRWRCTSANRKSFYECNTCMFKYRFGTVGDAFLLARVLAMPVTIHLITLFSLCMIVFAAGFIGKTLDYSLTWFDVLRCFNLQHILTGAISTGIASLLGWLAYFVGPGGRRVLDFIASGSGGSDRGSGTIGLILLAIATVVGLCIAFSWLYEQLEHWARSVCRRAQHVVLDVHSGVTSSATGF
uniref:RING-CH-type domain-containing protein n=1 Tax=Haptolina brevifila TaxID=156173 RepID=A0A7S2IN00_9EUKA|mmetsp:Transcript_68753/g.136239  ORF Transcript_68753/g.136239 Transcript_68753/m.136239 type:complete len:235 (+) Transcript_68753:77-781(+)